MYHLSQQLLKYLDNFRASMWLMEDEKAFHLNCFCIANYMKNFSELRLLAK